MKKDIQLPYFDNIRHSSLIQFDSCDIRYFKECVGDQING